MKDEGWAGRLSKWSGVVQSGVLAELEKKTQHRWWFSSPIENVGRKIKKRNIDDDYPSPLKMWVGK